MSVTKIIKALKEAGLSEKKIKNELASAKETYKGFGCSPKTLAMLLAKKHGISIENPVSLCKFGCTPQKYNISDINTEINAISITTDGFIIGKKKGTLRNGKQKITIRLTDGTSTINTVLYEEALEQYNSLKFNLFDKIKLENVKAFGYPLNETDKYGVILTANRYSKLFKHTRLTKTEKIIQQNILSIKDNKDNNINTLNFNESVLNETPYSSSYSQPFIANKKTFLRLKAKELRKKPSSYEKKFIDLKEKFEQKFIFQHPVIIKDGSEKGYIIDFYFSDTKVAVEIDGGYHTGTFVKDLKRDYKLLKCNGIIVKRLKLSNDSNIKLLIAEINDLVNSKTKQNLMKKRLKKSFKLLKCRYMGFNF